MEKFKSAASTARLMLCLIFLLGMNACKKNDLASNDDLSPSLSDVSSVKIRVDSTFYVTEVASAEKERARLQQKFNHTDFRETGFYLEPEGSVNIDVEVTEGNRAPRIIIGTLSRYYDFGASDDGGLTYIQLKPGRNVIQDTKGRGGMMYIQYSNSFNVGVQKATVKFVSGMRSVPYFKLGQTTQEEWRAMLSQFNNVPNVVISTRRAIVVVSLKNAYLYQKEDLSSVLSRVDAVYDSYDQFAGLDGKTEVDKPNIHKVLMTEMDKGTYQNPFMFTANKRTVFLDKAVYRIITSEGFNSEDGYGVWHEMGHMYQMSARNWSSTIEATVQLYAFRASRMLGNTNNPMKDNNIWPMVQKFVKDTDPNKDFNQNYPGISSNNMAYWVRTGMFYQLWLHYGDDFYIRLNKYYRHEPQTGFTDEDRMLSFMMIASKISNNDLTDFFKKWGFKLEDKAFQKVKNLNLPKPSVDISAITD